MYQITTDFTENDVSFIAQNMRKDDVRELSVLGTEPLTGLNDSVKMSNEGCFLIKNDDEPVALFGFASPSVLSSKAAVWMLSTENVRKIAKHLVLSTKSELDDRSKSFKSIYNFVHVENKLTIKWLKIVGFTFESPQPLGVNGELFLPFHMDK